MVSSHPDLAAGFERVKVRISGGELCVHRRPGTGPSLVLSHGLTDNGLCWGRFVRTLPSSLDIVLIDARGHGESSRIVQGAPFDPASDLAEALDSLAIDRALIMGHSVGAAASAAFAARRPDRVEALILEDPPLLSIPDETEAARRRKQFREYLAGIQAKDDAALAELSKAQERSWHHEDMPAWIAAKRQVDPAAYALPTEDWLKTFAAIAVPTLLVCGDPLLGSLVSPQSARQAIAALPNLQITRIANAGHNVRRENLQEFAACVNGFLLQLAPQIYA